MRYWIGIHTHRHGVSSYLFTTEGREFAVNDFVDYLGTDFEPNRDDEFAEVQEMTPVQIEGH